MLVKRLLKTLLNIKQTVIEKIECIGGPDVWDMALIIHVRPTKGQLLLCPKCKKRMPYYDEGAGERDWCALDLGTLRVYLHSRSPRIQCQEHGVLVAKVSWARNDAWFTHDFEKRVTWVSLYTSRQVVASLCRIECATVGAIVTRASL